jgi:hypothetical protein
MQINQERREALSKHFASHTTALAAKRANAEANAQSNPNDKELITRFWRSFTKTKGEAATIIAECKAQTPPSVEAVNQFEHKLKDLSQLLNSSTIFLPSYDLRTAQESVNTFSEELTKLKALSGQQKKFTFRSRTRIQSKGKENVDKNISLPSSQTVREVQPVTAPPHTLSQIQENGFFSRRAETLIHEPTLPSQSQTLTPNSNEISCQIVDKNETAQLSPTQLLDFSLNDLEGCVVLVKDALGALRIFNLTNCKVFCGPVLGSIQLHNCKNCVFVLASYQLRIHGSSECDFYLATESKPIIESSTRLRFGPGYSYFCHTHPSLTRLLENNFSVSSLQFGGVEDFDWPRQEQSPNWSMLPEVVWETSELKSLDLNCVSLPLSSCQKGT